jgi:hypothetical protein
MKASEQVAPRNLRATLEAAEIEVQLLLSTDGSPVLEIVTWLSAHFAAMDRAVYPVVRRSLPDGRRVVATHRELISRISHLLRVLERHHSGDILASGVSSRALTDELRPLVAEQYRAESSLISELGTVLDDSAQATLAADYERVLPLAPTRPHPHLSRAGAFTPVLFWLDGVRDRLLDTMDGRHVPVPRRPRRQVRPGLWGNYWLAQQQQNDELTGGPMQPPRP